MAKYLIKGVCHWQSKRNLIVMHVMSCLITGNGNLGLDCMRFVVVNHIGRRSAL